MPANTPLGISYPLYTDPIANTQAYFQDMATDMDGLVQQLDTRLAAAAARPGVLIVSFTGQALPPATPTVVTFSGENFDQGGMADIATNNTRIQLLERGIYVVGASISLASTVAPAGGYQAALNGSAGLGGGLVSARGSSSADPAVTPVYLNPMGLWFADGVTPVNITVTVTGTVATTITDRNLFAAKVSNTLGGF